MARQPNQCSTAKSKKPYHNINRLSGMPVSIWERPSQRDVSSDVSEGSNWNVWTDRQQEVVPKGRGTRVKCSCTCVGLGPRDWQTYLCLISMNDMGVMWQAWSEDKQVVWLTDIWNFTELKLPFLIFCHQCMMAETGHWLHLTFGPPWILLTLLFSWEDLIGSGLLGSSWLV